VTLIQYWLFYRYDSFRAVTAGGLVEQQHPGDWESVMIGLGKDHPLFAAYTAHCGGNWYPWEDVQALVAPSDKRLPRDTFGKRTHPLVFVAQGSHANYVGGWNGRPPDWGSCRGVDHKRVDAVTYAVNVHDLTGDAWRQIPEEIVDISKGQKPMSFPGRWGRYDITSLRGLFAPRTLNVGDGPKTPSLNDRLWNYPTWTIFCEPRWHAGLGSGWRPGCPTRAAPPWKPQPPKR
jgi:hypothetical protein